jgi:hypothetical protein
VSTDTERRKMEPLYKTIHDALTGETWQEELTAEEYAQYVVAIEDSKELYPDVVADVVEVEPVVDLVEGEQP